MILVTIFKLVMKGSKMYRAFILDKIVPSQAWSCTIFKLFINDMFRSCETSCYYISHHLICGLTAVLVNFIPRSNNGSLLI